jgi:hypothetical protein
MVRRRVIVGPCSLLERDRLLSVRALFRQPPRNLQNTTRHTYTLLNVLRLFRVYHLSKHTLPTYLPTYPFYPFYPFALKTLCLANNCEIIKCETSSSAQYAM